MSKFKFVAPSNAIAKFARDRKGNPIGLVAAFRDSIGTVRVGWSFKHKLDRFDRSVSWAQAVGRGYTVGESRVNEAKLPYALIPIYNEVLERATRFFKCDSSVIVKG